MSNLSELLPTGGGQNAVDFVASGTLSSGQTVVLNSDGTVSAVSATGNAASISSQQNYTTNNAYYNAVTSVGDNKVVVFYVDGNNSSYHYCAVGTISGSTITWETPVVVESNSAYTNVAVTYSPTDGVVIFAYSISSAGRVRKASLSGTTLTFGTAANFTGSGYADTIDIAMAETQNYAIVVYRRSASSFYGYYRTQQCGNGTTVSQGSETAFKSANSSELSITANSTIGDLAIAYKDVTYSYGVIIGAALVSSYSSTFSFSGESQFDSPIQSVRLSKNFNETLDRNIVYWSTTTAHKARVFQTNGSSVVAYKGSNTTVSSATSTASATIAISDDGSSIVFSYADNSNSNYPTFRLATMTDTTISFSGSNLVAGYPQPNSSGTSDITSNGSSSFVFVTKDNSVSDGASNIVIPSSSNYTSFIGITAEAISDTATGAVNVYGGINEAQTGLTIGADYYVQADGSLSTTASDVKVGQAISATTINMMDLT